jgi:5-methylcytosine-specific restriction endonuclease McrA
MSNYNRFNDPKYIEWSKLVKERDSYTCQLCNKTGGEIHAHHKDSWDIYIDKRFNTNNGVTLCKNCHMTFHDIYGHGKNSKYQFNEFKKILAMLKKIAKKKFELGR